MTIRRAALIALFLLAIALAVVLPAAFVQGPSRAPGRSPHTAEPTAVAMAVESIVIRVCDDHMQPLQEATVVAARRALSATSTSAEQVSPAGLWLPRAEGTTLEVAGDAIAAFSRGEGRGTFHATAQDVLHRLRVDATGTCTLDVPPDDPPGTATILLAFADSGFAGRTVLPFPRRPEVIIACQRVSRVRLRLLVPLGPLSDRPIEMAFQSRDRGSAWKWTMAPPHETLLTVISGTAGTLRATSPRAICVSPKRFVSWTSAQHVVELPIVLVPTVTIVDARTRKPVPSFRCVAWEANTNRVLDAWCGTFARADGTVPVNAPDMDLAGLAGEKLRLLIQADGYRPTIAVIDPLASSDVEIALEPGQGRTVRGRLRSSTIAVAGHGVTAAMARDIPRGLVGPLTERNNAEVLAAAITDADGSFFLTHLPVVPLVLTFAVDGAMLSKAVGATEDDISVVVDICSRVPGVLLTDAGGPIADAEVWLEGDGVTRSARSNADGGFAFEAVPFGAYDVGLPDSNSAFHLTLDTVNPPPIRLVVNQEQRIGVTIMVTGTADGPLSIATDHAGDVRVPVPGKATVPLRTGDAVVYRRGCHAGTIVVTPAIIDAREMHIQLSSRRTVLLTLTPPSHTVSYCHAFYADRSTEELPLSRTDTGFVVEPKADLTRLSIGVELPDISNTPLVQLSFEGPSLKLDAMNSVIPLDAVRVAVDPTAGRVVAVRVVEARTGRPVSGAIVGTNWACSAGIALARVALGGGTSDCDGLVRVRIPPAGCVEVGAVFRPSQIRTTFLRGSVTIQPDALDAEPVILSMTEAE